jgi:hypothetical protein
MLRRFSKEEIQKKNSHGTWLSPIAQPIAEISNQYPPSDSKYKKFLGTVALNLETICEENERFSRTPPKEIKERFELLPKDVVVCSPLTPTHEISNDEIQFDFGEFVDAARFRWHESLRLNDLPKSLYSVQVRVHSKIEVFHDYARPTYSINLKSYGPKPFSLRLLSLVNTEWNFAQRAAKEFSKPIDFYSGLLVKDSLNRTWVDDQVIKRAAYHYAIYQVERTAQKSGLALDDKIRFAHFLIFRSHLPQLKFFDGSWFLSSVKSDSIRKAA